MWCRHIGVLVQPHAVANLWVFVLPHVQEEDDGVPVKRASRNASSS